MFLFCGHRSPLYHPDDPWDQDSFKLIFDSVSQAVKREEARAWCVVMIASVGAISGRLEVIEALSTCCSPTKDAGGMVAELKAWVNADKKIFRGGQAHGPLKYTIVPFAMKFFYKAHADELVRLLLAWVRASPGSRCAETIRLFASRSFLSAQTWQAGDYYTKRFLEILVLASVSQLSLAIAWSDLDVVLDLWPLGSGTKGGLLFTFPHTRQVKLLQEGLRVLQRALGGGVRQVPVVTLSAMLCHWKRHRSGSVRWA